MSRRERAKAIQSAIGRILLEDWDPIGVRHEPVARDEYDGYIGGVYRLLVDGASAERIAARLAELERVSIGLPAREPAALLPVAEKLRALDVGSS